MIFRASESHNLVGKGRGTASGLTLAGEKYVRSKWLEHEKLFRIPVVSKQLTKGIVMEEEAIRMYGAFIGNESLAKNEDTVEIEELQFGGTCDTINGDTIIDIKCPYMMSGFMEGDLSKQYEWQLRSYMMLYDKPKAQLVYVLMDMPEDLMQDEWRRYCWNAGILDDATPEAQQEYVRLEQMLNPTLNPAIKFRERFKVYDIERDEKQEELLKYGLKAAMEYYETITLDMQI